MIPLSVEPGVTGYPMIQPLFPIPPTPIFWHELSLSGTRDPYSPPSQYRNVASHLQATWFSVVQGQLSGALTGNHVGFVSPYDEADTYVVQHDFMHLSFFEDDLDSL